MSYYIYKICCDDLPNYNYVGSTKAFRQRKNEHKSRLNKGDTKKIYNTIRENGGWDNWRMVILEDLGEVSFIEARIKEEEHRVKLNANMNSKKCYTTEEEKKEYSKEYFLINKEKLNQKGKEWRENNKEYYKKYSQDNNETIKLKWKTWYNNNKEHVLNYQKNYNEDNKEHITERQKKYREKNKEHITEKQKEYREQNKEQIKEWRSKKVTCECGCLITQSHINRHKKTNNHLDLMKHLEKI